MYYFVILLTIVSVALELMLVVQFPFLLRVVERSTFTGIMLSILLSWGIGAMFGAAGVIIMTAAVTSTIITVLIYRLQLIEKINRKIISFQRLVFVIFHPIQALNGRREV